MISAEQKAISVYNADRLKQKMQKNNRNGSVTHAYRDASDIYPPTILCHYLLKNSIYLFEDEKRENLQNAEAVWLKKGSVLPSFHFEDFWKADSFDMKHQLDILGGIWQHLTPNVR